MSNSRCVGHEPCPACGSKDNLARYEGGSAYCFGCQYYERDTGDDSHSMIDYKNNKGTKTMAEFLQGTFQAIVPRKLSEDTCRRFGYSIGEYKGQKCHIANFYKDNQLVGQKLRFRDKTFQVIGTVTDVFFGANLCSTGKYIVITEGELDALSVAEVQHNKWPVVSIPNGVDSAKRCIQANLKWLEDNFESIVLMFDNDEVGLKASAQCSQLFSPGKCLIASLPLKDASDMLVAGRGAEVVSAMFHAQPYRPQGIVTLRDIKHKLKKKIEMGLSYPWPSVTAWTYGIRLREIIILGAGTGMGKTEIFKEIILHLIIEHKQKCGVLFLEEANDDTSRCLVGKHMNLPIHIPGVEYDEEHFDASVDALVSDDSLVLYDHFGCTDYDTLKASIRHMVVGMGCKYIFIDHLTMLVSGLKEGDERKMLAYIMTDLASMVRELDFTIFAISHLATPEGKPHEEGGRVQIKHFFGSRALGQLANFLFGFERNQQDPDKSRRNVSTFRCLKDRYTGRSTGETTYMRYNTDTGRLLEDTTFNPEEDYSDTTGNPEGADERVYF